MSNEFKKQCGAGYYWCNTDKVCKPLQEVSESEQTHKWALVQKSGPAENRVEVYHHHTNEKPPHSPGRGAVWYKKKENEWHEHGEHGRTDYRNVLNKHLKEDGMAGGAPTNAVGGGQVAGIGVGPQGEPGVKKKKVATFISYMSRKMPK
jgi:hypothetical protein